MIKIDELHSCVDKDPQHYGVTEINQNFGEVRVVDLKEVKTGWSSANPARKSIGYDNNHMLKIKRSFKNDGWKTNESLPILQLKNNRFEVLAGRHRLEALRELKVSKFPFQIFENLSDEDTNFLVMNTNESVGILANSAEDWGENVKKLKSESSKEILDEEGKVTDDTVRDYLGKHNLTENMIGKVLNWLEENTTDDEEEKPIIDFVEWLTFSQRKPNQWLKEHADSSLKNLKWKTPHNGVVYYFLESSATDRIVSNGIELCHDYPDCQIQFVGWMRASWRKSYKSKRKTHMDANIEMFNKFVKAFDSKKKLNLKFNMYFPQADGENKSGFVTI